MSRSPGARILVVDDEESIRRALRAILTRHGFQVEAAETGQQALDAYGPYRPDLILLDLGLPDMTGLEVIRRLRSHTDTPIVIVSVHDAERDKVAALDLGADDYVTKPFGIDELLARIRVALRHVVHPTSGSSAIFRTGDLEVDIEHRAVRVSGQDIHLTPTEYELLKAFITHPGKVLTDRMLLQQVWGPEYGSEAEYLHVYVARLRKKIEADARSPRYIITEMGAGYRLLTSED
jgi:two-component system, OmpR family, KDP operon response regulator KdpE